jgi:hypothetical protein
MQKGKTMTLEQALNFQPPWSSKPLKAVTSRDWVWTFSCLRDEMKHWDALWKSGAMTAEHDARCHAAADRLHDLTEALRIVLDN